MKFKFKAHPWCRVGRPPTGATLLRTKSWLFRRLFGRSPGRCLLPFLQKSFVYCVRPSRCFFLFTMCSFILSRQREISRFQSAASARMPARPDTVEIYKKLEVPSRRRNNIAHSPLFQQSCVSLSSLSSLRFLQQHTQQCTPDSNLVVVVRIRAPPTVIIVKRLGNAVVLTATTM